MITTGEDGGTPRRDGSAATPGGDADGGSPSGPADGGGGSDAAPGAGAGNSRRWGWGEVGGLSEEDLEAMRLREENELLMENLVRSKLEMAETQSALLWCLTAAPGEISEPGAAGSPAAEPDACSQGTSPSTSLWSPLLSIPLRVSFGGGHHAVAAGSNGCTECDDF